MNVLLLLKPKVTVSYIYSSYSIRQCLETMRINGFTAIPVIDEEGKYIGTIDTGDLLWYILSLDSFSIKDSERLNITTIIRKDYNPAIKIDTPINTIVEKIMVQNFVPVVDDRNYFVGIITRKDVINFLSKELKKSINIP